MAFLLLAGVSRVSGQEVYSYEFTDEVFSKTSEQQSLGGIDWTMDCDGGYWRYEAARGQQFGSSNNPATTLTLSTEGISGTIANIKVSTSGAKGIDAKLQVKVGGATFGDTCVLTNVNTEHDFTGNGTGKVELLWTNNSAKAIYVKKIEITYQVGELTQVATPVLEPGDGTDFTRSLTVKVSCATVGAVIHYTDDGNEPSKDSKEFRDSLLLTKTTTLKVIAVKDGLDISKTVSATYTKLEGIIDDFTYRDFPIEPDESTSYGSFTDVKGVSGAVYAGNAMVSGSVIQLREDSLSGIVITASGGHLKYVKVAWNAQTTEGHKLDVYGKNTAYESAKDLRNDSKKGKLLDTISKGITTLEITDDYAFVGIMSETGTVYLDKLSFIWEKPNEYRRYVTSGNWGTVCLSYAVEAGGLSGADFFSIAGKVMEGDKPKSLVLNPVTTGLEAGVPYIFSTTSDTLVAVYSGEAVGSEVNDGANGLTGSFKGMNVPVGKYVIYNNQVQKCGTGCTIPANCAYIDLDGVSPYTETISANQRVIALDDGGMTRIEGTKADGGAVDVYTIDGVEVRRQVDVSTATLGLPQGVYVVNGKKVVVK